MRDCCGAGRRSRIGFRASLMARIALHEGYGNPKANGASSGTEFPASLEVRRRIQEKGNLAGDKELLGVDGCSAPNDILIREGVSARVTLPGLKFPAAGEARGLLHTLYGGGDEGGTWRRGGIDGRGWRSQTGHGEKRHELISSAASAAWNGGSGATH